jgi:hypothetical protein
MQSRNAREAERVQPHPIFARQSGLKGDAFEIIQFTVGERIHRWACLDDKMEMGRQHHRWDKGVGSWLGSDNPINGIRFLAMKLEKA